MKKFHFYLVGVEPEYIPTGLEIGQFIRRGLLYWNKKQTTGWDEVVKITLWLSQKPLRSIVNAKINGYVYLDRIGNNTTRLAKNSPKQIIRGIIRRSCGSCVEEWYPPLSNRWFARAKVEKV